MEETEDRLIALMRKEIEEYGALLNLIQEQQESIFGRDTERLESVTQELEIKIQTNQSLTKERETLVAEIARSWAVDEKTPLSDMLHVFEANKQPLFQALIEEVSILGIRTREKTKQNQMLLMRACELTESLIRQLSPDKTPPTYNQSGKVLDKIVGTNHSVYASG